MMLSPLIKQFKISSRSSAEQIFKVHSQHLEIHLKLKSALWKGLLQKSAAAKYRMTYYVRTLVRPMLTAMIQIKV